VNDAPDWRPRRHPALRFAFDGQGQLFAENTHRGLRVPAPSEVLELLAACDGSRSSEDIVASLSAPAGLSPAGRAALGRALLATLRERALFAEEPGLQSQHGYSHPAVHRVMLGDRVRTEAFRLALDAVVREGDVVVDVGAGSGILSLFAARAGAGEVHAIERSGMAPGTREVVALDPSGPAIQVHTGDAVDLDLGDLRADVIVSEWLGQLVLTEGMFPAVVAARDRWLRPQGTMIPAAVELFLAPFDAGPGSALPDTPTYWSARPYGVDFGPLLRRELDAAPYSVAGVLEAERLLAPPQSLVRVDCGLATPDELYFSADLTFRLQRSATLSGCVGFFRAELAPGIVLDTAPGAPPTHWQQHLFFTAPQAVEAGSDLGVHFAARPAPGRPETPIFELEVCTGDHVQRRVFNAP
jgi:SAM-dependent methyltransferase